MGNRLGEEGAGFGILMAKLVQERLSQAIRSAAAVEAILEWTVEYTSQREIFGKPISDFQNTQFKLAELSAEAAGLRTFVDASMKAFFEGKLTGVDAAKVRLVASNLHCKTADECLQFFGGYGYVFEFPIARAYVDARVSKIAGGALEVMKQIIGRDLFS